MASDREDVGVDHLSVGQVLTDVPEIVHEIGVMHGSDRPLSEVADLQPLDIRQPLDRLEDDVNPGWPFHVAAFPDVVKRVQGRAKDLQRVQPSRRLERFFRRSGVEWLANLHRVLDGIDHLADVGALGVEPVSQGEDQPDDLSGLVGGEWLIVVQRVVQQSRLGRLPGADRLVVQGADDRPGAVALVKPQAGLVRLQIESFLHLGRVVGRNFEEQSERSSLDQVFLERLVQGPAKPPAPMASFGDDEVEVGISDLLEEVGEGETNYAVAFTVSDQHDAGVSARGLFDQLPLDVVWVLARQFGKGRGEKLVDLAEGALVVFSVDVKDMADSEHASSFTFRTCPEESPAASPVRRLSRGCARPSPPGRHRG